MNKKTCISCDSKISRSRYKKLDDIILCKECYSGFKNYIKEKSKNDKLRNRKD